MNIRLLLVSLAALLTGLISTGAMYPEHQQDEPLPRHGLSVESAILIDAQGVARCRIGEHPGEYLTAEELGEFYAEASRFAPVIPDDLRECDENDEAYARLALDVEERADAALLLPAVKALGGAALIGATAGCVGGVIMEYLPDPPLWRNNDTSVVIEIGKSLIIGLGGMMLVPISAAAWAMNIPLINTPTLLAAPTLALTTMGAGLIVCHDKAKGFNHPRH